MAYLTSGMTHLITPVRRYTLKVLSKFLEHFPVPMAQYAVRIMPNLCYIFMISRVGVAYKGVKYRSTQQLCVTVLDHFLSVLFENNKLGIPSSKKTIHTHTHNHMKMNLSNIPEAQTSTIESIYFSDAGSEKALFAFDKVAQTKIQLLTQLLTRKLATQENLESKSLKLDATSLMETADISSLSEEDKSERQPTEQPSLKKLLQEEVDLKIYNLEDEESLAEFFKLIFNILVEVWIEIFEEQRSSAASHQIQAEYVLTIIKCVLDITYQLLYAFEHTQQGTSGQTKNVHTKTVNRALKGSLQHFVTRLPMHLSASIRKTNNNIDRTNASLLSMLSFCFGKFSTEKGSKQISYKEWELVYVKQFSLIIGSIENYKLENEDFSKLLGSFYRIYKYLPRAIGSQIWRSLTNMFMRQGPFSSKQELILEFFASVGLQDESITPPPEVIEQWVAVLVPMLCRLDESNMELSKHILNVLLSLAKNPKFQSFIKKDVNENIIPFFFDEEKKTFGPFINLPKRLQSLALQLVYYFETLPASLMKQISKCCCNVEKRLDFDMITQVIEVIRHHTSMASKECKLKPAVHISFLCTALCFVCSPTADTQKQIGFVGIGDVVQEIVVSLQDYSSTSLARLAPFLKTTIEKQLKTENTNVTLLGSLLLVCSKCMQWSKVNNKGTTDDTQSTLLNSTLPKILIIFLKHTLLMHKRTKSSSGIVKDLLLSYYPLFDKVLVELNAQSKHLDMEYVLDIVLNCLKVSLPHYHHQDDIPSDTVKNITNKVRSMLEKKEFSEHSKKNQILGLLKMNE